MKNRMPIVAGLSWLGIMLVCSGCGTSNVNPAAPRSNTGYVDFYTDSNYSLAWEVKQAEEGSGKMRTVFCEYKPLESPVLRLAAPPGTQTFQVWFMNEVTQGPKKVQVEIENGRITPVHITLTDAGTTSVDRKVYGFRPSAKGYGRGTKIERSESAVYEIGAVPEKPQPYQVKAWMPYFASATK